jgi:hypothetical protein
MLLEAAMNNQSPHRYHLEMLATEIQPELKVVLIYPDGEELTAGTWSAFIRGVLKQPGDRPLVDGFVILLIHDATRQPWQGRPPAIYVALGEEVRG